eukprot:1047802_1
MIHSTLTPDKRLILHKDLQEIKANTSNQSTKDTDQANDTQSTMISTLTLYDQTKDTQQRTMIPSTLTPDKRLILHKDLQEIKANTSNQSTKDTDQANDTQSTMISTLTLYDQTKDTQQLTMIPSTLTPDKRLILHKDLQEIKANTSNQSTKDTDQANDTQSTMISTLTLLLLTEQTPDKHLILHKDSLRSTSQTISGPFHVDPSQIEAVTDSLPPKDMIATAHIPSPI